MGWRLWACVLTGLNVSQAQAWQSETIGPPATPPSGAAGDSFAVDPTAATPPSGAAGDPFAVDPTAEADAILSGDPVEAGAADIASTTESIRYSLLLVGFDELDLEPSFASVSLLREGRRRSVDSFTRLLRRVRDDRQTALRLLHAHGWYAASVEAGIDRQDSGRVRISLAATPGQRYRFAPARFTGVDEEMAQNLRNGPLARQKVGTGDPAISAVVLLGEQSITEWLLENAYPFSTVGERTVVVDHADQTVTPGWTIALGEKSVFGAVSFPDEKPRLQRHLATLARFEPGEPYDQRQVDDLRNAIVGTGLFSTIQITPERQPGSSDPGIADIVVRTEAAKRRTVALSGGYGTGEGVKAEASWQHRSIFGGEEKLTLLGRLGTKEQSLRADLALNNFRRRDQVLLSTVNAGYVDTDAYTGNRAQLSASLERLTTQFWQKQWTWSVGALAEYGDFRESSSSDLNERATWTVALPLTLRFDGTDNLFDPTGGYRLAGMISPEMNLRTNRDVYVRTDITGSAYWSLREDDRLVLAVRGRAGIIAGAGLFDIAVTRRYFAGGGGSVRGFEYQGVGPVDSDGDPTGGRAVTEASLEGRWRLNQTLGLAVFVDAGAVDSSSTPKIQDPRFGAGVGVRYYAPFGPVRVDVATPVDHRSGESRIGVYVSIGQSF